MSTFLWYLSGIFIKLEIQIVSTINCFKSLLSQTNVSAAISNSSSRLAMILLKTYGLFISLAWAQHELCIMRQSSNHTTRLHAHFVNRIFIHNLLINNILPNTAISLEYYADNVYWNFFSLTLIHKNYSQWKVSIENWELSMKIESCSIFKFEIRITSRTNFLNAMLFKERKNWKYIQ